MARRTVTLSARSRGGPDQDGQKGREFYTFEVNLTPGDKSKLSWCAEQERIYYNVMVDGLSARLASSPEIFMAFSEAELNLLGAVAENFYNLRLLMNRSGKHVPCEGPTGIKFPTALEPFRKMIFAGEDGMGKFNIPERMTLIYELAAMAGKFLPSTRRAMAIELIKYFQNQSKGATAFSNNIDRETGERYMFKTSFNSLTPLDRNQKRHVQLQRSAVRVSWNEQEEATYIRIPYIEHPIKIPTVNLVSAEAWNHVLIHQEPGKLALGNTPWVIELRKTDPYLVKYVDFINPKRGSAHSIANTKHVVLNPNEDYEDPEKIARWRLARAKFKPQLGYTRVSTNKGKY